MDNIIISNGFMDEIQRADEYCTLSAGFYGFGKADAHGRKWEVLKSGLEPITGAGVADGTLVLHCGGRGRGRLTVVALAKVLPQVTSPIPIIVFERKDGTRFVRLCYDIEDGGEPMDMIHFKAYWQRSDNGRLLGNLAEVAGLYGGGQTMRRTVETYKKIFARCLTGV